MPILLKSKQLSVGINELGAELCSVKNSQGLEFMWQAEKESWPRHAPVLFPIVGKLNGDSFSYNNHSYTLSQHGFARDKAFKVIQHNSFSCLFELQSSNETKTHYPFDFIFQIHYHLEGPKLSVSYKVINPSEDTLLFSVGAHPGFNCPLLEGESFEDYYLEFENSRFLKTELNNGLRKESKTSIQLKQNKLPLHSTLFEKDALIFEDSQIHKITLASTKSPHRIFMECQNWPYFGIWSKKGCTKFICLEPWYGIADKEMNVLSFDKKDGLIRLAPKKEFNCSFSMTFV